LVAFSVPGFFCKVRRTLGEITSINVRRLVKLTLCGEEGGGLHMVGIEHDKLLIVGVDRMRCLLGAPTFRRPACFDQLFLDFGHQRV